MRALAGFLKGGFFSQVSNCSVSRLGLLSYHEPALAALRTFGILAFVCCLRPINELNVFFVILLLLNVSENDAWASKTLSSKTRLAS